MFFSDKYITEIESDCFIITGVTVRMAAVVASINNVCAIKLSVWQL